MWDLQEETTPATRMRMQNIMSTASPSIRQQSASRHDSVNSNLQKYYTSFDTSNVNDLLNISRSKIEDLDKSAAHTSLLKASIQQVVNADFTTDVTMYSAALLAEDDPGIEATSGLFNDFLNALVALPSDYQVFELVQRYEQCCSDQLELLWKLLRLTPPYDKKICFNKNGTHGGLLRTLYQDRIHTEATDDAEALLMDTVGSRVSDHTIIENFYRTDSVTRHCQIIIDWLEQNAAEQLDLDAQLEHFSDTSVPWENTLHFLNKQQSYLKSSSRQTIVNEMDPDAPIRQNYPLHDLDKEDDARMYKLVFSSIRGGALERAQDLSIKCGQPWLAAALEGWRLYNDPNYSSPESNQIVADTTGNFCRDTWKSVCWNMAQDELLSIHERAIYAAYSGNLKLLLQACVSWEDYLWGYLRVMVDQRVEQELRDNSQNEEKIDALPEAYFAKSLTVEQVFKEMEASSNDFVKDESQNVYHIIQKFIVLDNIDGSIEQMCDLIQQKNDRPSHHLIRFMAHLTLFLRSIGKCHNEELCISILEAYVEDLINEKKTNLVAHYVATLPNHLQVFWYAKFLEGIKDKEERQLSLKLAENVKLDVAKITKTVVENIRNKEAVENLDTVHAKTTSDDIVKIEAIDWLVFDESQRIEAMKQANALMRKFIACKKIDATKSVFSKIPSNSVDVIIKNNNMQTGQTELPPEDDNAIREYICIQAYLQAQDAFNDWFEHFHHSKPVEPKLQSCATFSELISYEHQMKQYQSDLDRWNYALSVQTKVVKDAMYNVLLFIDGGWMIDQNNDVPEDETRSHQLKLIRQICIPQITFLLHSVLYSAKQFKESVQLADILASEQTQLYKVFKTEEIKQFLSKVRDSSLELLDENMDSFGFSLD
ncbi:Nuclear pore complex protein Nup107 [Nymphon striatum]|nr:Nuclear pore complex protein Nup107 [Nymphon striatum]